MSQSTEVEETNQFGPIIKGKEHRISVNIYVLIQRFAQLQLFVGATKVDVICLSEINLSDRYFHNESNSNGYSIYVEERIALIGRGEVCIYVEVSICSLLRTATSKEKIDMVSVAISQHRTNPFTET